MHPRPPAHPGHHAGVALHPAHRRASRARCCARVRTVIVDEIHAVADDKRGSHLALSLARLDRLVEQNGGASRSASASPPPSSPSKRWPRFLERRRPHRQRRPSPRDGPGGRSAAATSWAPVASNEMWDEIYDRLAELIREHRTTLVFVNTRRLAERVAHHLAERLGENAVLPHHGSLSRALRLEAERRLKSGELRAVVATASLELGIDIGTVDLVCQIGSPRSIAVALQRIGRSGHWVGALPKGRLFATTRDELIECAALVRAIRARRTRPPRDSAQRRSTFWRSRSWPPAPPRSGAKTSCSTWSAAPGPIARCARAISTPSSRCSPKASPPRAAAAARTCIAIAVNRRLRGRRGARLTAITSGGAIPDTANTWWWPSRKAQRSARSTKISPWRAWPAMSSCSAPPPGASAAWRPGRVRVEDAHGAAPSIPFWRGEAPGRTRELSAKWSRLREEIAARHSSVEFLQRECGLDRRGAEQALDYVLAGAGRAGRHALHETRRRRALLRRRRRHAAGDPRALRRAHQPRLGPGAAQALLPLVQLRAAGRRHRQRHRASRWASSTRSRWKSSSNFCAPTPWRTC